MNSKKLYLLVLAIFVPTIAVCVFMINIGNIYASLAGIAVVVTMFVTSYNDICGKDSSVEDVLEDKDIQSIMKDKNLRKKLNKAEFEKVSNPEFWLNFLVKVTTVLAFSRNVVLMQISGLVAFFFFSERQIGDSLLYLSLPSVCLGVYAVISLVFFRKKVKLLGKIVEEK